MPSTIPAGRMNRAVTVMKIREDATVDASGHVDETLETNWRIIRRYRKCRMVPALGRENIFGDQVQAQLTHRIDMRFDSESATYGAGYRAVYFDRKFNFSGPGMNVDEYDTLIAFPAVEVPAQ